MGVHIVTSLDDYYSKILDKNWNDKLIICYFTAKWCSPCQTISPIITKIGDETDNILVLKIDVDDCDDVAEQCKIESMPTFYFHLNNNLEASHKLVGADKSKLLNIIGSILIEMNNTESTNTQTNNTVESSNTSNSSNTPESNNTHESISKPESINNNMELPFLYNPNPNKFF